MIAEQLRIQRLTNADPAAIAVIQVSGSMATESVLRFWTPAVATMPMEVNAIRYGIWQSPHSNVGEQVVVCQTNQDVVEVHCHGGHQAASRIMADLESILAGDERALAKGDSASVSSLSNEAIQQAAMKYLVRAKTARAAAVLLDQWRGALTRSIERVRQLMEAERRGEASELLSKLLESYSIGKFLVHPYRLVVAGPPNVGKSSLINAILGYNRVIVHETAGTTRDVVGEMTSIDGWTILLNDTAGFRNSDDDIERQGIQAARHELAAADLVLILVDAEQGWSVTHQELWENCRSRALIVATKSDLKSAISPNLPEGCRVDVVTSASTKAGLTDLLQSIAKRICATSIEPQQPMVFRQEQFMELERWQEQVKRQA